MIDKQDEEYEQDLIRAKLSGDLVEIPVKIPYELFQNYVRMMSVQLNENWNIPQGSIDLESRKDVMSTFLSSLTSQFKELLNDPEHYHLYDNVTLVTMFNDEIEAQRLIDDEQKKVAHELLRVQQEEWERKQLELLMTKYNISQKPDGAFIRVSNANALRAREVLINAGILSSDK